jgi:hypothetical protein
MYRKKSRAMKGRRKRKVFARFNIHKRKKKKQFYASPLLKALLG